MFACAYGNEFIKNLMRLIICSGNIIADDENTGLGIGGFHCSIGNGMVVPYFSFCGLMSETARGRVEKIMWALSMNDKH